MRKVVVLRNISICGVKYSYIHLWVVVLLFPPRRPFSQTLPPRSPTLDRMETFSLFGDLRLEDPTVCLTEERQLELESLMPLIEALESRTEDTARHLVR
jgi:hypothetical protein